MMKRIRSMVLLPLLALAACGGGGGGGGGTGGGGGVPGTLALGQATYGVTQPTATATLSVTRIAGSAGAVSVSYATSNGTATAGTDYTSASGTLNWADGDSAAKSIDVPVSTTPFTGSHTFTVTLSAAAGGATLGTPASATVTITGSGAAGNAGTVSLAGATAGVGQAAGSITLQVARSGGSSGAIGVSYGTSNGSATAGNDYRGSSGQLSWADGDSAAKPIIVPISNATPFVGTRTFTVTLTSATGGASITPTSATTVTITGSGNAGTLAVASTAVSVNQAAGTVNVTVARSGGTTGAVGVSYSMANGTATAGTDYTGSTGTLSWADGDASNKTVAVPLATSPGFSGTRTFTVTIATPTGGAALGAATTTTVTITGSGVAGSAGTLALSAATAAVGQSAGSVSLTVTRSGGSSGAVSVAYATANGTASSGADYTATTGTLNWASGDATSKTVQVPISNATPFSGTRTFTLAISAPGGGATLGSPASATVTITGSAASGTLSHNGFRALPAYIGSGGYGVEWVNGETRLVKDNSPLGSGELFGFVWDGATSNMYLMVSGDNGGTWNKVASAPSNGCGGTCPNHIIALTQDSASRVHAIGWQTISDSGYYLRFTLAYSGGHISGYSLDTPSGIALPNHNRKGTELRADIKLVSDGTGAETLVYAVNMPTVNCTPVCDIKVYMGRATTLAPTSAAQFTGLTGAAGDTLVFDSCAISACSTFGFSTHVHTALFAQNAATHDLYLFQGPIDGDYGLSYADSTFNTVYMRRLASSGANWSVGASLTTISSTVQANVTPELMSVASGGNYAWLMYVHPAKGITFGRVDAAGTYSETAVPSPDATVNRNGWGVLSVAADDSKIWAIWDTLAPITGGSAKAAEGYWDGATWTTFADAGASDSMGMTGVSGWRTGTAAIKFNGNVLAQTYAQPTAAAIWSE